jgi:hypothetical protein
VKFSTVGDQQYQHICDPSIRGNSTVNTNSTDPELLSAAQLPPGATALLSTTSVVATETASPSQPTPTPHSSHHLSGGAITGIVLGSVIGACVLLLILLLLLRRGRREAVVAERKPSDDRTTSISESTNDANDKLEEVAITNRRAGRRSELPAVVPSELDSRARVELPPSEKMERPELPDDSPVDRKDPALFRNEETPETSPMTSNVSPATNPRVHNEARSPVSPISPIFSRRD